MLLAKLLTRSTVFVLSSALLVSAGSASAQLASNSFAPDAPPLPKRVVLPPQQQGDLFMARKMYREAIDAYREGNLKDPIIWDKIGIAWHQLGDLSSARKSYEQAVKIDSKYADAINNIGTIYYSQKRYRTAIARYRRALAISPESASVWSNLGTAYYAQGKYVEMSEAYSKALQLDPMVFEGKGAAGTTMQDRAVADKARYHFEMARIYAQAGKSELALQNLRKCFEEGFKDKEKLNKAPEFATLRDMDEFKEILTLEPRVL